MHNLIEITVQNYDEKYNIVFIEKQGKNMWSILSMMQFEDDMEYWDKPTRIEKIDGKKGFLFDKQIDTEDLVLEIERFIDQHKVNECVPFLD